MKSQLMIAAARTVRAGDDVGREGCPPDRACAVKALFLKTSPPAGANPGAAGAGR